VVTRILDGFIRPVRAIRDPHRRQADGPPKGGRSVAGWAILMKDKRIRHRSAEIGAVAEHLAKCFVITRETSRPPICCNALQ
jgi:hypothetical protein